jgi:subtilisin family serine protease
MKILKECFLVASAIFFVCFSAKAQSSFAANSDKMKSWQLLDYQQDSLYGASVNRAYDELLKGKKSHPVIVAVIDQGVDINHEDLQGHIWTNKKEVPGNGKDDDENGYTDDLHGWNFLGGKDGRMLYSTSSEADREYARLFPEYGNVKDSSKVQNKNEYQYFLKAKEKHLTDSAGRKSVLQAAPFIYMLQSSDSVWQTVMHQQHIYLKDLKSFEPTDSEEIKLKNQLIQSWDHIPVPEAKSKPLDSLVMNGLNFLEEGKKQQVLLEKVNGNKPDSLRKEIVRDNPYDINDRNYGNNNVGDQYAFHGTHCAGIIAAARNNGVGMNGVADDVFIMPVRVVNTFPYGDERDKDVALGIRYAVDNGAQIISMSFGKNFSPQKQWVYDAIKYAESKGVLMVHAAGNDASDNDSVSFYPNKDFPHSGRKAKNFITVGAISSKTGFNLPAVFSDYGKKEVDVFAPGVNIYSSIPVNEYASYSGTSMACPVVAGIAALILEYYPHFTAEQLKDIVIKSATPLKGKKVYRPGSKELVDFSTLSSSGGVVNAYNALKLAAEIAMQK